MAEGANFDVVGIALASPKDIRVWSRGEVKKPETINYRTFKPERDGLFCERIFGPSRDWECHCGKYKKVKFKGIICDRCGVEVTRAKVRRRRMGHIELAAPVCHIWYLKGVPSPISLLLDMSTRILEKVVYFASYIVTHVDVDRLRQHHDKIQSAVAKQKQIIDEECQEATADLQRRYEEYLKSEAEGGGAAEEPEEEPEGEEDEEEGMVWDADWFTPPTPQSAEELTSRMQAETEAAGEQKGELDRAVQVLFELQPRQLISELDYRALKLLTEVCASHMGGDFSHVFHAGLGAQALQELLKQIDLEELSRELRKEIEERTGARRARAIKRLKIVEAFRKSKNRPEWMVLEAIPVLPPELRPMVQLDGGRFATSDLNDLYRRIINRNNRLRRIVEIKAPESIINHEKRLLQEAVDALIDNGRRARPVQGSNKRPLKSLSDMLKGKEGRFRKNLLGKRVDYSGRSVIVVGPDLRLHQAGIPREMALELFKPFVMKRLVEKGYTTNIKTAKRMVDRLRSEVWDALEEVIEDHPVLLNRAPTLHRLGIQAFEPVLIDGKAIQLHPLVCHAFNADFDGDQMAVHVPLSAHAQAEARLLMLASSNLFKPADGKPVSAPMYDIVLGCYYMTQENPQALGSGKVFQGPESVETAYAHAAVDLHASIKCRLPDLYVTAVKGGEEIEIDTRLEMELRRAAAEIKGSGHPVLPCEVTVRLTKNEAEEVAGGSREGALAPLSEPGDDEALAKEMRWSIAHAIVEQRSPLGVDYTVGIRRAVKDTTVGRVLFNQLLPLNMQYRNHDVAKDELSELCDQCYFIYGQQRTADLLDRIKQAGFKYATRSGLSISLADTQIGSDREAILRETERQVEAENRAFRQGAITAGDRERLVLELWRQARDKVADSIFDNIDTFNPLWMMSNSGARAKKTHICQIAGVRGLMIDPFGRLIEDLPVKSNFQEGLNVLEYFVSTHGARKGLADVALRTADAGYLTRRLVDVAQDVIVREEDCGTTEGILVTNMYETEFYCPHCGMEDNYRLDKCQECGKPLPENLDKHILEGLGERIYGRSAAEDVIDPKTGEVYVSEGHIISREDVEHIEKAKVAAVRIYSPMTCELKQGVCAKCYGYDLAVHGPVDVGTAVGIIAAQSIGEPGTQLTMRTFHTGGIAAVYLTGVAEVKRKKQEALQSLHEDIDRGLISLEATGGERERTKAIQDMLKVLETPVSGLLRVVELFEARKPKGQAITASVDGVVAAVETKGLRRLIIHAKHPIDDYKTIRGERLAEDIVRGKARKVIAQAGEKLTEKVFKRLRTANIKDVVIEKSHLVPHRGALYVREGQRVRAGDRLTAGPLDPQRVLQLKGVRGVQEYLIREIQAVYRVQGVSINDKHIEVIVRQMLRKRKISDHGDSDFLEGQVVDRFEFEDENRRVAELGGDQATAEWILLGITEASLATESFLSAASFQRTTRVLAEAAVAGKKDPLLGLKENVIIGRLIPAGSGMPSHRDRDIAYSEEALAQLELPGPADVTAGPPTPAELFREAEAALQARLPTSLTLGAVLGVDDEEDEGDEDDEDLAAELVGDDAEKIEDEE
ncbi:MAG: DNA-directed RNA polymerase subunit beta' [Armatimonadetes bacterium]|nr:DNA-directed RNA polymerase subunit beta' [Armatimonadota bacterium]